MSERHSGRRNQLVKFLAPAVLGFIACVLALVCYGGHQAKERHRAADTKREVSIAKCVSLDSFVLDPACAEKALNAKYDNATDDYDLKAQQEMAMWALLMLIVTSVGVYYVILTLQAATEANEGFAISAMREQRAYVFVNSKNILEEEGAFHLEIVFKNGGKTPAFGTMILVSVEIEPEIEIAATEGPKVHTIPRPSSFGDMAPDHRITLSQPVALKDGVSRKIIVSGQISYWDFDRNRRVTDFHFFKEIGDGPALGGSLNISPTGNKIG